MREIDVGMLKSCLGLLTRQQPEQSRQKGIAGNRRRRPSGSRSIPHPHFHSSVQPVLCLRVNIRRHGASAYILARGQRSARRQQKHSPVAWQGRFKGNTVRSSDLKASNNVPNALRHESFW
ncbi:uncharacterized protein BJ212DRAFT_146405 [Suillus subaureus]|uniref:Uncharacterized protein n=1 Tax=Suillus subaureus TaxID=48587 RepID=A0A9P7J2J2_9AGAM|nr:uncharacterized protein BJ212DRAFT_146405 [Suillus subaureus]KAG1799648.1 hypothetical protein BJ212DRAFT_146405 [Suillus subaureus]